MPAVHEKMAEHHQAEKPVGYNRAYCHLENKDGNERNTKDDQKNPYGFGNSLKVG
jgi:hypothetical protein